jgi:hypothetical protein
MLRHFCLVGLALSLTACAPRTATTARVQSAIVAGTVDDHDAAVVVWEAHVAGDPFEELCTAEIISPHVVLTAAHCTKDPGVAVDYHVSGDVELTPRTKRVELDEVHRPAEFVNQLDAITSNGYDVAVGISYAGFSVPPISYNRAPLPRDYHKRKVRIIGYGISDTSDGLSAGTRREGTAQLADFSDKFVHLTGKKQSVCQGDSGGPALLTIAGHEAIVGLSSFAPLSCEPERGAVSTNVAFYADFIDSWVNQFDSAQQGLLGESCNSDRDCQSLLCGSASGDDGQPRSFCTDGCHPGDGEAACPSGYRCSDLDGDTFCMPPGSAAAPAPGGCDFAQSRPSANGAGAAASSMALAWAAALAARARRRRIRS